MRRSPFSMLPLLVLAVVPAGCVRRGPRGLASPPPSAATPVRFTDVTRAAGIRFQHTSGASGRLYLPETMGAGCAFLDYDGDGWPDLFLVNSAPLPGFPGKGPFYPALYRNRGDGSFQDVTRSAGLAFECYGIGCAVGDYDNDGAADLYVTALGGNHLFHNERARTGAARFVEVTGPAGVGGGGFSTSSAWVDYDRDGFLDLFVCRYARWSPETNHVCRDSRGQPHGCTPTYYPGEPSLLYHNDRDGTFTDVTRAAGVYSARGKSLGVAVTDVDGDGWPDLLVANDQEANALYRNNRDGTFADEAVLRGVAYSTDGKARAGMGVDTADLSERGADSIFIGNRDGEGHAFFEPDAAGQYTDRADEAGILEPGLSSLTFGALFRDYDLDGFPDLITASGHVEPNIELMGGAVTFAQRLLVFHNDGGARPAGVGAAAATAPSAAPGPHFTEVAASLGPALATRRVWRGLAEADIDHDGDPDFLVSACNGPPMLLRNDGANRRHWLQVRLEGVRSNRAGLGSRVVVAAGGRVQRGWVRSGSSYGSASELQAQFGLGEARRVERVTVQWASGREESVRDVAADQLIVIREGRGIVPR